MRGMAGVKGSELNPNEHSDQTVANYRARQASVPFEETSHDRHHRSPPTDRRPRGHPAPSHRLSLPAGIAALLLLRSEPAGQLDVRGLLGHLPAGRALLHGVGAPL